LLLEQNRAILATVFTLRTAIRSSIGVCAAAVCACASNPGGDGFDAFLQKIAADCKPLIIGNDNMGQAIMFNGLGANPDNYNNFLTQTKALYAGSIPPQTYRTTLTSFVGTGSYSQRSFDCIEAHLPTNSSAPAPTPK
jgi:hypothetical protein